MAWYDTNYKYKKQIVIDHTKVSGGSDLSNFPVLISMTDANLKTAGNGGQVQNASGFDIIFTNSTETIKLDHEIEKYVDSTGEIEMWVRIPTLSASSDTVIYLYYGNNSTVSSSQENKTGVWDSNFNGVYHLGDGTTLSTADSTSNAQNGTNNGATATTGQIDGGASFDGTSNYISLPTAGFPTSASPCSIECWVQFATVPLAGTYGVMIAMGSSVASQDLTIYYGDSSQHLSYATKAGTFIQGPLIVQNTPYHCVGTYDGSTLTFYVNGVSQGTASATLALTYGAAYIGQDMGGGSYFPGLIDETRISNIARSAGWITTEYNNQNSPGTFYSVGSAQNFPEPSAPLPKWTLRAITSTWRRVTQPVNIPRYVPRGLLSTIANYSLNLATRFRLRSADIFRDIASRFLLASGGSVGVYYGSSVLNGTLTTASSMSTTTGGTETSKTTSHSGSTVYGEVWSQGNASLASVASIPATPTGRGWVSSSPGAGTFATGNWSATFTLSLAVTGTDFTVRVFRYRAGAYTLIGTFPTKAITTTAKTAYAFTATSFSTITFAAGDLIYTDLWLHDTANVITDNPVVWESNSATAGVASDVQITTSTFTASGGATVLKDVSTRLRQRSADTLNDIATRFRQMSALDLNDVAARFRIRSADQLKDIATRLRLMSASQVKDMSTRVRLMSTIQFKDISSRFKQRSADQLKDVKTRLRLISTPQLKDIVTRLRLMSSLQFKDIATRIRLRSATTLKDIATRFRQRSADVRRDLATRVSLGMVPLGPTDGPWYLAFHDEFDDTTGMSGPTNGVQPSKWNTAWYTGPTSPGSGDTFDLSDPVNPGEIQYYGPSSLIFPGDGAIHLRLQAGVDNAGTFNGRTVESGILTTAGLMALNPANVAVSTSSPDLRPYTVNGKCVLEIRMRIPGPNASAGSYWPSIWFTNAGNYWGTSPAGTDWPGGRGYFEEIDVSEWYTFGSLGSGCLFNLHAASSYGGMSSAPSSLQTTDLSLAYHTYTYEFTATTIQMWIDGIAVTGVNPSSSQMAAQWAYPQYLLMNFAAVTGASYPTTAASTPNDMMVDYVRVWRSTSLDEDIATRFRLKSTDTPKDLSTRLRLAGASQQLKDLPTRFRQRSANLLRDLTSRLRLMSALSLKDIRSRVRLMSATQLKDVPTRLRLMSALQAKDITTRLKIRSANQLRDISSRFLLSGAVLKDIASRLRLMSASQLKDVKTRFKIAWYKDITTRIRVRSLDQLRDVASRLRVMSALQNKDTTTRFRQRSSDQLRDVKSRIRLQSAAQLRDFPTRLRLQSAAQLKDIASRLSLVLGINTKDMAARVRLRSADQLKDIASRLVLSLASQRLKDISTRLRLQSAAQFKDLKARLALSVLRVKDITTRVRLMSALQVKDTASRLRLRSANRLLDLSTRLRQMSMAQTRDVSARLRQMSASQVKDVVSRLRLSSALQLRDISARVRLRSANLLRDVASRVLLVSQPQRRDVTARYRLSSAWQFKDVTSRLRQRSANQLRDVTLRLVLALAQQRSKDVKTRFRMMAVPQKCDVAGRLCLYERTPNADLRIRRGMSRMRMRSGRAKVVLSS